MGKFKELEDLLYSYNELLYRKRELNINLRTCENEADRKELELIDEIIERIDNVLTLLKAERLEDYLVIKLRYIDRLDWELISIRVNREKTNLIKYRRKLFEDKLEKLLIPIAKCARLKCA